MDWSEQQAKFGALNKGTTAAMSDNDRINLALKQASQPKPRKTTWLSSLPSVLAAGASLIPGVGTGAAAALGGVGEAANELFSGQSLSAKNIGEQAALSAIPGGLGKIGKVAKAVKGGQAIEEVAPVATQALQKVKATQIPVRYTSSLANGKGAAEQAQNLLINPTVGDITDATSALTNKGYSVNGRLGNFNSATTPNTTIPTVKLNGAKTTVRFQDAGTPTTSILPGTGVGVAKNDAITNGKQIAEDLNKPAGVAQTPSLLNRVAGRSDPTNPSLTAQAGSKIRSANRGIQVGTIVPGEGEKVGLTAEQAKAINGAVDRANTGVRSRTVRGQIDNVQKAKASQQQLIDAEVGKANRDITVKELGSIKDSTAPNISNIPDPTGKVGNYTTEYDRLLNGAKDTKGLNDFIKTMDKEINYGRSATAPDPLKERVAQAYRDAADKKLVDLAPNAKAAKTEWANLHSGEKILSQGKNIEGQGLDVFKVGSTLSGGRGIGGGVFQAAKEGVGKTLEAAGADTTLPTYGRGLLKQVITRGAAAPVVSALNADQNTQPATPEQVNENQIDPTNVPGDSPAPDTSQNSQTANVQDQLDNAIQQALAAGDTKGLDNLLKVADYYSAKQKAAGGSGGLNSTASGVIADTKTGLDQLAKLSTDITNSNANSPIIGQLRAKNPYDTNAQNLQASIATAKQIVGKALEGGVLRAEDEKKYAKILPTVGDTDTVAQHKIQQLIGLISGRLNEYQSSLAGGSGGTDLAELGVQ